MTLRLKQKSSLLLIWKTQSKFLILLLQTEVT